ncbi:hypothetical protein GUJ93_ZPchr0001g32758 [Zizania palustris]|uniref:Uncharacterized protein n=1 Tax=Zizania palustris TaxID=103762 RepID=A0A8J5RUH8_ZIZPA|nr:hypothetical protein GUJ93_ZPchr0001g32758 [Zizania palustris]
MGGSRSTALGKSKTEGHEIVTKGLDLAVLPRKAGIIGVRAGGMGQRQRATGRGACRAATAGAACSD